MKKEKRLNNNSVIPDPDSEFVRILFKLADDLTSEQVSRIKNGDRDSKTFFLLKQLKHYSLEIPLDDKTSTVENFIKGVEDRLMAVMQSPTCYQILSEIKRSKYKEWSKQGSYSRNFLEELKITDLSVLSDCTDYLDKIYKKEKLFQKDLFERLVAITRLFYAYLILNQLFKLLQKIKKDSNDPSIWIDAYKIGLLQGNLGLIESFSDPDIEDIHYHSILKKKVSKSKRWADLNMLKEAGVKMATKEYRRGVRITHVKMAVRVLERLKWRYPELTAKYSDELMLKTLRKAIKPVASEYGLVQGVKGGTFTR
jgi:hypothetical protein